MNIMTDLRAVCDQSERQFNHGQLDAALLALPADMGRARPDLADHSRLRLLLTRARLQVSMVYLDGTESRPAHHALNDALRIAERRRDVPALAAAHHERGRLSAIEQLRFERPDYTTARAHLEKALALREASGSHADLSATLAQLGSVAQALRQPDDALAYTSRAYAIAKAHCHKTETADAALNFGMLLRARGDSEAALRHLNESLRLREETGLRVWMPFSHQALGETFMVTGRMAEARQHIMRAIELASSLHLRRAMAFCALTFAEWLARSGLTAEAMTELRNAHRLALQLRHETIRQRAADLMERLSA